MVFFKSFELLFSFLSSDRPLGTFFLLLPLARAMERERERLAPHFGIACLLLGANLFLFSSSPAALLSSSSLSGRCRRRCRRDRRRRGHSRRSQLSYAESRRSAVAHKAKALKKVSGASYFLSSGGGSTLLGENGARLRPGFVMFF